MILVSERAQTVAAHPCTRAPPHAYRTAPAVVLRADYMPRTGLGRRSMGATLDGSAAVGHGRITIMLPVCTVVRMHGAI